VLTAAEARHLLDSIKADSQMGLRDRALIGVMVYSFARVSAVVNMNVDDYYRQGKRSWFRLHEKNGKFHEVPVHHTAEEYLDAYLHAVGMADQKKTPLFRPAMGKSGLLRLQRMSRVDARQRYANRIFALRIGRGMLSG